MTKKLKDYQVLDVFCGGTFYKVRHKVTNNIFAWKAYNCSAFSDKQIKEIVDEVKTISGVISESLLRYYDTILHGPSKTLYFVLEYNSWQSLYELVEVCRASDQYIAESFIWYLLFELARVCKEVETLHLTVLQTCITTASIFVNESGELRVNCFDLGHREHKGPMRQVGDVILTLFYSPVAPAHQDKECKYSDDLRDVVSFLTDDRDTSLRPDVVLYHPTVLSNIETLSGPKQLKEILISAEYVRPTSKANKCDSEKAVELSRAIEPLPRRLFNIVDSPIYSNISPKRKLHNEIESTTSNRGSLSPTLAALALELPGFVPRSRKPYSDAIEKYHCPQKISEDTLSQQWMSRLVALRQREESLNMRERDLIAKEIVNSPAAKVVPLNESEQNTGSNGITLPPMITQATEDRGAWESRRRSRRASVRARPRRKSYAYEDLDSSLSADAGDGSVIITATKFTKENMPRRNIFPDVSTKKVHFTSANPFTESDDSVTLTFYELENLDSEGYQVPRQRQDIKKDLTMFKYLDLEKLTTEKRAAMQGWSHSSPSKQAKTSKSIFGDITNTGLGSIGKTPSKSSLTSRSSNTSRQSIMSSKSQWSMDSSCSKVSDNISGRTRASTRQPLLQTPIAPPDIKKSKSRKSLLPFKTPFKFKTSTKV